MPFLWIEDPDLANRLTDYPEYTPDSSDARTFEVASKLGLGGSRHLLGDPTDLGSPAAAFGIFPAGFVVPRHAHRCHRMEVVVRGSLTVDATGEVLEPGHVMISRE